MKREQKPETYAEKEKKLRDMLDSIKKIVLARDNPNGDEIKKLEGELVDRANYLRGKHVDTKDYAMFHVLIGSSIRVSPHFDFSGNDSVETFIHALVEKYRLKT